MRKLSILCRKLLRLGVVANVVSRQRGCYVVHFRGFGYLNGDRRVFSSVRECEQFLLTLFR